MCKIFYEAQRKVLEYYTPNLTYNFQCSFIYLLYFIINRNISSQLFFAFLAFNCCPQTLQVFAQSLWKTSGISLHNAWVTSWHFFLSLHSHALQLYLHFFLSFGNRLHIPASSFLPVTFLHPTSSLHDVILDS